MARTMKITRNILKAMCIIICRVYSLQRRPGLSLTVTYLYWEAMPRNEAYFLSEMSNEWMCCSHRWTQSVSVCEQHRSPTSNTVPNKQDTKAVLQVSHTARFAWRWIPLSKTECTVTNHLGVTTSLELIQSMCLLFVLLAAYANRGCVSRLSLWSLKSHLKCGTYLP